MTTSQGVTDINEASQGKDRRLRSVGKTTYETSTADLGSSLVGKNALVYAVGTMALRAVSFILVPLYTRTLSAHDYGLLATLLTVSQILSIGMDLGARQGLIRFGTEFEDRHKIAYLMGSSILLSIVSAVLISGIALVLLPTFARSILHTEEVGVYIALTCCLALVQALYSYAITYYRVKNEGVTFIAGSLAAAVLLVVFTAIALVLLDGGIKGALIAQILSYGGLWILVGYQLFERTGLGLSGAVMWKLCRFGSPLVLAMSSDLITDIAAVSLLSYFGSLEDVAVYSLGNKMAQVAGIVLIAPFQLAYGPFVYAHINTPSIRQTIARIFTYLMLSFAFVAFGVAFLSRGLLSWMAPGPSYAGAHWMTVLMLPRMGFAGIFYIADSLLQAKSKTHWTGIATTVVTLVGVAQGYFLVQLWGVYGVIAMVNLTWAATAVVLLLLGMKAFPIPVEWKRLGIAGGLTGYFLLAVLWLRDAPGHIYYGVLPIAAIGSLVILYWSGVLDHSEKQVLRCVGQRIARMWCR